MEVKVAFATGLFLIVFSMLESSQAIPDNVVYTEVKKTLISGTTGILRCRFKGLPNAVYWKKGSDPAKSPSIIIWSYGGKSGPRYEDGSCDIDENYSLVIRNVRNVDAGRYICRVSNYKEILIHNYTDVIVTNIDVRTEQSVTVQIGIVGVVPCQVNIRPKRVSWVRGANDTLVSMDLSRSVVERSGPGYEEGLFNITSEYSLLINDVKILHEDSYFCEVTDFETGNVFRNVTRLNVLGFPLEPFPSIEECPREQQDLSSCTLRISAHDQTTLTCEVREYYPVIDLFFIHGSIKVDSLDKRVWQNSDGTKNKRVTIATNGSSDDVFQCVATGLVGEAESRSMTIHLIRNVQQTRVAVGVVVPIILVSAIIISAVGLYVIRRRKRHLKRKYDRFRMDDNAKRTVPDCQRRGLEMNEIHAFLKKISRHCLQLTDAIEEINKLFRLDINCFGPENRDFWIDKIVEENRTALFDSYQMIEDWWTEQNCSNYDKISRLRQAANVPKGRTGNLDMPEAGEPKRDRKDSHCEKSEVTANQDVPEESDEKWPSTKKLGHIVKLVPETCMKQLWDALQISFTPDDLIDEKKRFKTMCRWRAGITKLTKEEKSKVLSTALKSIGYDGLLSPPKGRFIYKAELVDMALDLIMEDLRPFACSLGIEETKFTSYRQEFHASHLEFGTIRLVLELCQMIESISVGDKRQKVCSILDKAGYPNVMKRFISASEPSYGELVAIATAVTQDDLPKDGADTPESRSDSKRAKERTNKIVKTGHGSSSHVGEKAEELHSGHLTLTSINVEESQNNEDDGEVIDTDGSGNHLKPIGDIKNESKRDKSNTDGYRQRVGDLQKMFELTEKDIPDSDIASVLTLLKIWKERVCPGLIDHRVVLAEGLQKINKTHHAAEVINGRYQSTETSMVFIEDMLDRMDGSRQTSLERLLKSKEHWIKWLQSSDMTSQWICDWVADWTKDMESSARNQLKNVVGVKETPERHRDFNDKLVDNGFLDLAREIMNLEQVL